MASEPTRYDIATFDDFAKVPDGKMDECLDDFREWLSYRLMFLRLPEDSRVALNMNPKFIWIDDGERGVSEIRVTVAPEDET